MKTGALTRFACIAGAILGKASAEARERFPATEVHSAQAFQIADDLLDVEGDAKALGKATGKDAATGKATLVGILGIEPARKRLAQLVTEAEAALSPFGDRTANLRAAARFVADRRM